MLVDLEVHQILQDVLHVAVENTKMQIHILVLLVKTANAASTALMQQPQYHVRKEPTTIKRREQLLPIVTIVIKVTIVLQQEHEQHVHKGPTTIK